MDDEAAVGEEAVGEEADDTAAVDEEAADGEAEEKRRTRIRLYLTGPCRHRAATSTFRLDL